ncbi:hypothetical protein ACFSJU_11060 [Paradesertivirga mongoliensis]|uniref:YqzM family protein n=1 Tax=Paradesertivirga mongoliensis TaxID=2100740 RepID=A0ABW4ZM65_9SPHI|nr:hypothetical protein [Pedobacter mongoliensis]
MKINPTEHEVKQQQQEEKDNAFLQSLSILFAFVGIFAFAIKLIFL